MNKFYSILVAFVVTLFASSAFAFDPPASPAPASWISDPSHVLSDEAHARLDAKLKQINQSSANEIAALILPTLDGSDISDVGDLTSKAWGVGKKGLDNGVLVVLAMKEHKSRISTGKGVEGDLPDLKCNDILQSARPYLRSGNVEGALGFIFDNASSSIANHRAEVAAGHSSTSAGGQNTSCDVSAAGADSGSNWPWGLVFLALGLTGWYLAHRAAARRREQEETERQAREDRARQRQLNLERETARRAEEVRLNKPAPPIVHPTPVVRPIAHTPAPQAPVAAGVTAAAGVVLALQEEENRRHHAEAARKRREEEEEAARRRRRQQEEDDDRRRRSEESSSSSSSSSSFDWGGSSGGSGGFGGGDSGGGGSSSDW